MDFDNPKVYSNTAIFDGVVLLLEMYLPKSSWTSRFSFLQACNFTGNLNNMIHFVDEQDKMFRITSCQALGCGSSNGSQFSCLLHYWSFSWYLVCLTMVHTCGEWALFGPGASSHHPDASDWQQCANKKSSCPHFCHTETCPVWFKIHFYVSLNSEAGPKIIQYKCTFAQIFKITFSPKIYDFSGNWFFVTPVWKGTIAFKLWIAKKTLTSLPCTWREPHF